MVTIIITQSRPFIVNIIIVPKYNIICLLTIYNHPKCPWNKTENEIQEAGLFSGLWSNSMLSSTHVGRV